MQRYVTYLFFHILLHQRVKKLFENFLQMCCMRIISCLIDSSRQGSLKCSGPEGDQSEIRNQSCEGAL